MKWKDITLINLLTTEFGINAGTRVQDSRPRLPSDLKQCLIDTWAGVSQNIVDIAGHIVSRVRYDHQHKVFFPFPRTTSTLLLAVSLSRHQDSGTLFHRAVGLLTLSRTDLRHSFSVCDGDIVARASVLWRVINW